jgi:hypothetical protein
MIMRHPYQSISSDRFARYLIPLIILTLFFMFVMNWLGSSLNNSTAPSGIISFELAGDVETSSAIIDSWDPVSRVIASFSLGLDYLFLILYSSTIAMGCIWAMNAFLSRSTFLLSTGILLAWGQWLAALFDGVENAALLKILLDEIQAPWPQVAQICAVLKFSLIALGLIYIVIGALIKSVKKRRG